VIPSCQIGSQARDASLAYLHEPPISPLLASPPDDDGAAAASENESLVPGPDSDAAGGGRSLLSDPPIPLDTSDPGDDIVLPDDAVQDPLAPAPLGADAPVDAPLRKLPTAALPPLATPPLTLEFFLLACACNDEDDDDKAPIALRPPGLLVLGPSSSSSSWSLPPPLAALSLAASIEILARASIRA